jgi:hypothetical protein
MSGYFIAGAVLCVVGSAWTIARPERIVSTIGPTARVITCFLNLALGALFLYAAVHL